MSERQSIFFSSDEALASSIAVDHPSAALTLEASMISAKEQYDRFPSAEIDTATSFQPRPFNQPLDRVLDEYLPRLQQSIDENGALSFLSHSHWPKGFQDVYVASCKDFVYRFVLIDNSGSMMVGDGHKIQGKGRRSK